MWMKSRRPKKSLNLKKMQSTIPQPRCQHITTNLLPEYATVWHTPFVVLHPVAVRVTQLLHSLGISIFRRSRPQTLASQGLYVFLEDGWTHDKSDIWHDKYMDWVWVHTWQTVDCHTKKHSHSQSCSWLWRGWLPCWSWLHPRGG